MWKTREREDAQIPTSVPGDARATRLVGVRGRVLVITEPDTVTERAPSRLDEVQAPLKYVSTIYPRPPGTVVWLSRELFVSTVSTPTLLSLFLHAKIRGKMVILVSEGCVGAGSHRGQSGGRRVEVKSLPIR